MPGADRNADEDHAAVHPIQVELLSSHQYLTLSFRITAVYTLYCTEQQVLPSIISNPLKINSVNYVQ